MRKGILLAGGLGTRFYPATHSISKQLLPVYDKPMIYYPLSTLMQTGIQDILLITLPHEQDLFKRLLGEGAQWGIQLSYAVQQTPAGIAQAFTLGEKFLAGQSVCLMLGDNILYGDGISQTLQAASHQEKGATLFGYQVNDPERYGVIYFDEEGQPTDIVEKPMHPTSRYAAIGLYFYDSQVVEMAKQLKPSPRGELEITDISLRYLRQQQLTVKKLGRGVAWLDTGTPEALLEAASFIQILERRQGVKIGAPEEVAWRMGLIGDAQLMDLAQPLLKSGYGQYLISLVENR